MSDQHPGKGCECAWARSIWSGFIFSWFQARFGSTTAFQCRISAMGTGCTAASSPSLSGVGGWNCSLLCFLMSEQPGFVCRANKIFPLLPSIFPYKVAPGWHDLTSSLPYAISMKSPSLDSFGLPGHISHPLLPL